MDEQEFIKYWNIVQQYYAELSEHLTALERKVDEGMAENDKQINELRTTVYDEIINPANEYIDEMDRNDRFEQFNEKHGEKLKPFNEELAALEGDDFDLSRTAFDAYDSYEGDDKMDEDEYVDQLVEQVQEKLADIKAKLGVPEDTEVAVQETEDGDVEVVTEDGDVIASTDGEEGGDEATEEKGEEEDDKPVEITGATEIDDDPDEVAAFEEELKNQK